MNPDCPTLLVVFRRHHPAGTAHIAGAEQDRKIEERLLEVKPHGVAVDDLDRLGALVEDFAPSATIVFETPFHVIGCNRRAIMKLDSGPQLESGALGVLGKIKALGQGRVVVPHLTEVFDQRVLQGENEIIGAGGAVMLLRVEPARGDVGVPGEHHLAARGHTAGRAGAADERHRQRRRGQRRIPQDRAPRYRRILHFYFLRCSNNCANLLPDGRHPLSSMSSQG